MRKRGNGVVKLLARHHQYGGIRQGNTVSTGTVKYACNVIPRASEMTRTRVLTSSGPPRWHTWGTRQCKLRGGAYGVVVPGAHGPRLDRLAVQQRVLVELCRGEGRNVRVHAVLVVQHLLQPI